MAVEEEAGAFLWDAFSVVAHIEAVLVLILVICDVLALVRVKSRNVLDVNKLVEVHTLTGVARPVMILGYLCIFYLAARVISDTECLADRECADRCCCVVAVCIAHARLADISRCLKQHLPLAVLVLFVHADICCGLAHACNYDKLFAVLCCIELGHPLGRLNDLLVLEVEVVLACFCGCLCSSAAALCAC